MKKINNAGFSAVEVLIVLVLVGIVGFIGYRMYSQQDDKKSTTTTSQTSSKELEAENKTLKKHIDILVETAVTSEGVTNTKDMALIEKGNEAQAVPRKYYQQIIRDGLDEKANKGIIKEFLTDKAEAQLDAPRSYSLAVCGQMKRSYYVVKSPTNVVTGSTAQIPVLAADDYGGYDTISLSLVKEGGTWLIDSFACPDLGR